MRAVVNKYTYLEKSNRSKTVQKSFIIISAKKVDHFPFNRSPDILVILNVLGSDSLDVSCGLQMDLLRVL